MMVEAGATWCWGITRMYPKKKVIKWTRKAVQRMVLVAYSLGNFVFDQYEEYTDQGLALRSLDKDGRWVCRLYCVDVPRPRLMSSFEIERIIESVNQLQGHWLSCDMESVSGRGSQVTVSDFRRGTGRLDRDGRPEVVAQNV